MSSVRLYLQPPPNVDFVHGYPGIPPGPDRPQASVKGALEVRPGKEGVKAKWVRIELRKVETLPGGGVTNTFYDFVGQSPVTLWAAAAGNEYEILRTQDFPFSIRIPESIPPTILLDGRAGIKYELVGSVCTRGPKGFLRKRKSIVVSTTTTIIIDKHDLHSEWPVYCQPETRQMLQDGVTLTVERSQTCYAPGDRISVLAVLKSDSLHTVILRGFEITLKESTVFRAGPFSAGKKNAPQARIVVISDNKFAVNATLYGGTQHRAELFCGLSPRHTTTTLNAARHIDITYTLSVKALMGTGAHLTLDLPVIVSNWTREVSHQAIRRIGPAPGLSLMASSSQQPLNSTFATPATNPISPTGATSVQTIAGRPALSNGTVVGGSYSNAYSTLPAGIGGGSRPAGPVDDFGVRAVTGGPGLSNSMSPSERLNQQANQLTSPSGSSGPAAATQASSTSGPGVGRRPQSAQSSTNNANRFTITNALPHEIPQDDLSHRRNNSTGGVHRAVKSYLTAEEEKRRMVEVYDRAKEQAEKVQGPVARIVTPPPQTLSSVASPQQTTGSSDTQRQWPSAEDEKMAAQRYVQAQAAAQRTQYGAVQLQHARSNSGNSLASPSGKPSAAALMYSQAMSSRNRSGSGSQNATPSKQPSLTASSTHNKTPPPSRTPPQAQNSSSAKTPPHAKPVIPQYMSAEEEKAALRRYEEAVRRTQGVAVTSPVAYDSLYQPSSSGPSAVPPGPSDLPPPFEAALTAPTNALSEKERMRRNYEAQDALAAKTQQDIEAPVPYSEVPPPQFNAEMNPSSISQAISEKERLRRKYAQQDAEAVSSPVGPLPLSQPSPPLSIKSNGSVTVGARARPPPVPPSATSAGSKILTAAEEKAMLRAKYEAEDSSGTPPRSGSVQSDRAGPSMGGPALSPTPPPGPSAPPPLMPRPPVEYIRETREEDARVSKIAMNGFLPQLEEPSSPSTRSPNGTAPAEPVALDMRPFTPFGATFANGTAKLPGPPPPLPPKTAGE